MKLSQFNFDLPPELIASHPAANRDEARMLVLHKKTGKIEHLVFKDIIRLMHEKDVVILTTPWFFLHVFLETKKNRCRN